MRKVAVLLSAICLAGLCGCGGGGYSSTTTSANGIPYKVYWNSYGNTRTLDAGQSISLSALATDTGAKGVTYTLSGPGTMVCHAASGFLSTDSVTFTAPSGVPAGTKSTLTATANVNPSLTADFVVTTNPDIVFPPQTLPAMYAGKPYTAALTATPGTGNLTYVVIVFGSLPAGLTLSRDGVLSGTPTAVGPYSFEIQVQDQSDLLNGKNQKFTGTVN